MKEKQPLLQSSFRYREEDPDYHGETVDESYGDGPKQQRGCTDVLCLIIFIGFLFAVGYVAVIAYSTGNPKYLVYPFDQTGQQCYYAEGYQAYDTIFVTRYNNSLTFVCVKQCPLGNTTKDYFKDKCKTNTIVKNCSDLELYASEMMATYCLPKDQTISFLNEITGMLDVTVFQMYFSDLQVAWPIVLSMVGFAFIVSGGYSILVRYFAGVMVWLMIIALMIIQFVIGLVCALMPEMQFLRDLLHYDELPESFKDRNYQIVVSVLCFAMFAVTVLVICCLRKQIRISIGVLKAAADFVRDCCSAFFLPLYTTILQVIFLVFWGSVILFLFSSNNGGKTKPIDGTPFSMIQFNESNQHLIIFFFFALLWMINFFSGLASFWVSSSAAIWYFEEGQPSSPVTRSICRSFKHLGSIAFGSLLIAIIMFIRAVLQGISAQMKRQTLGLSEGKSVAFLVKCASCCIACFQRVIRFLTENAYIMIAISGKNFCESAKQSFYLIIRSTAQFAVSHGTTKLFINLGTALIVTICCTSGYLFVSSVEPYRSEIQSPVFLTIMFAIMTLPIAWAFMEFYEKAANTILMCYCIEMDLGKKKSKCPNSLKNFLHEYAPTSSIQFDD